MHLERQGEFWSRSIQPFSEAEIRRAVGQESIAEGLKSIPAMLRQIYLDLEPFESKDYQSSFHNLMDTMAFLYALGEHGEVSDGQIRVKKENFENTFKKNLDFQLSVLPRYGFSFDFGGDGTEITVRHTRDAALLPALEYFVKHMPNMDYKLAYASNQILFMIADFRRVILKESISRNDISPVCDEIMSVVNHNEYWKELVGLLLNEYGLRHAAMLWAKAHAVYRPVWDVKFIKGKNDILLAHINAKQIEIEVLMTPKQAENPAFTGYVNKEILRTRGKLLYILNTGQDLDSVRNALRIILK